jgi:hypothetical protein
MEGDAVYMQRYICGVLIVAAMASCSKPGGDHEEQAERQAHVVTPDTSSSSQQHEDQTTWIIRACGAPSRDYSDAQAGTTWRHLVYGRQHVELIYQRFPGWTYISATDPRDTVYGEVLEPDEVVRRLPCSRGKLKDL